MAYTVSDYYDGSRILVRFADGIGIAVDQLNFITSQLMALILATLFRTTLHPSKTNALTRQLFGLVVGMMIGHFCFGKQALHLLMLPALSYLILRIQSPHTVHKSTLFVSMTYLSCLHIHRQCYDYGSYSLDVTGPLMVITQKISSLAFNLHDGLTKKSEELTKMQKIYVIRKIPNIIEYFSYVLLFPSLMVGPAFFYKDFEDFIAGKNYILSSNTVDVNNQNVSEEPSPLAAVYKKVLFAGLCAFIFMKFTPLFPISFLKNEKFVEGTSMTHKFWYLIICTTLVRFKYYLAWTLSDAICNNAGIGFNGYDETGTPQWNRVSNVDIYKFEFGTNLRESIAAWNVGTNNWLRFVVYDRVKKYPTVLTYTLSALWHGFYPGYYLTFANGALFTVAARSVRKTIRDHFTANKESKLFYDTLTVIMTRLVMAYITFSFVLLEFWASVHIYMHMYWCLHVLAALAIIIVPQIIPKADPNVSASKSSIAIALDQARPITNGVSRHHD